MRYSRTGLTVVELVVLISISSVALALILPAVQQSREAARNTVCRDNIATIGLASLEYEEVNGQFPPYMSVCENVNDFGDFASQATTLPSTYSLVQILPFVEQQRLADQLDPLAFETDCILIRDVGYTFINDWLAGTKSLPGVGAMYFDNQVELFRCPADTSFEPTGTLLGIMSPSNDASAGLFILFPDDDDDQKTSRTVTNYSSNAGQLYISDTPSNKDFAGLHGPIRSRVSDSIDTIPDGASATIMFGENIGHIDPNSATIPNTRFSSVVAGFNIGRPDLYGITGGANPFPFLGSAKRSHWLQFGSPHPDVVNTVRCDGTVRSVDRNIDQVTFGRLCSVADGQPLFDFNN